MSEEIEFTEEAIAAAIKAREELGHHLDGGVIELLRSNLLAG